MSIFDRFWESAALGEENFQQGLGFGGTDAVVDFGNVVALRVTENTRPVDRAAGFGVCGTVVKAGDAGGRDCACADWAGFQRDVQIVTGKALGICCAASCADGEDFGMGGGIGKLAGAVSGGGNDYAFFDHDCANGDLAAHGRHAGLFQGGVHEGFEHRACPLAVERIVWH